MTAWHGEFRALRRPLELCRLVRYRAHLAVDAGVHIRAQLAIFRLLTGAEQAS